MSVSEKIFPNCKALAGYIKRFQPAIFPLLAADVIFLSLQPFPYMFFSRKLLNLFALKSPFPEVAFYAALLVSLTLLLSWGEEFFHTKFSRRLEKLDYEMFKSMSQKTAYLDYSMLNSDDTREKMQNASKAINGKNVSTLILSVRDLASGILSLVLVTGVLLTMDWILIIIIIALVCLQSVLHVKLQKLRYDLDLSLWRIDRKMDWFLKFCITGEYAREIRLNQAQPFLIKKHERYSGQYYEEYGRIEELASKDRKAHAVLSAVHDLSLYLLTGWRILTKNLTVGDFSMAASGAATFRSALLGAIGSISEIRNRCRYFMHYHLYMEMPGVFYRPNEPTLPLPSSLHECVFTFEKVSFSYPGSSRKVLDEVSFEIRFRDVVAIVGENGAGKTTIVSLLCRLYDPTGGRILLNGTDIRRFDYNAYAGLFSVVSQDYKMFTLTVRENIMLGATGTETHLQNAVQKVGLTGLAEKWPHGLDTMLIKEFDPDGVDVSGGESQKIALARGICRNTPFLILDEPTSALDPLGERQVYDTIMELSDKRTVVFISHRLSSTQFADKILVLENGRLAESGTHTELMAHNGRYRELFEAQAEYYRDNKSCPETDLN